jgi:hypothetical protein
MTHAGWQDDDVAWRQAERAPAPATELDPALPRAMTSTS